MSLGNYQITQHMPDAIGWAKGYRSWLVDTDGVLKSINAPCTWPFQNELQAECAMAHTPSYEWWAVGPNGESYPQSSLPEQLTTRPSFAGPPISFQASPQFVYVPSVTSTPPTPTPISTPGVLLPGDWHWEYRMEKIPDGEHHSPMENCSCGIYAWNSARKYEGVPAPVSSAHFAVGSVKLWGKVVIAEEGYRAQYAYPEQLILHTSANSYEIADLLQRNYNVPVFYKIKQKDIVSILADHAPPLTTLPALHLSDREFEELTKEI